MSKAVIYARVSSIEQKKEGYSIPAQVKLLKEYAQKSSLEIVQEFTDSETAKQAGRTNFNAMLQFLKKHKNIRTILVEKTDRLYRNFKDYVILDEIDLEIHLVKENTVLSKDSKSHEKFIHGIKVLMAKNFIDNLSEEVKKGLREKAEQGYYPARPPYGYKKSDKNMAVIDTETSPFVKRAFELYAEGDKSLEWVRHKLYEEGLTYRADKPVIGKNHLERILKNIFYRGAFKFSGRIYSGLHEPLVTKSLFESVQEAFKKDGKPLYRNEHEFIFASLMTCGECGCTITAEIKKQKYIYYHCSWGRGKDNCSQKDYIKQEALEEQFNEIVKRISITNEQKEWIVNALKLSLEEKTEYLEQKVSSLQIQTKKLRDRINKIYIDKLDGVISEEFWYEKHRNWTEELEKIEIIISSFNKANDQYLQMGIQILELVNNAYDPYLRRDSEGKRELLKMLLSNCIMKDGTINYTYKKPFDMFAKGLAFTKDHAGRDSNPRPFGS